MLLSIRVNKKRARAPQNSKYNSPVCPLTSHIARDHGTIGELWKPNELRAALVAIVDDKVIKKDPKGTGANAPRYLKSPGYEKRHHKKVPFFFIKALGHVPLYVNPPLVRGYTIMIRMLGGYARKQRTPGGRSPYRRGRKSEGLCPRGRESKGPGD